MHCGGMTDAFIPFLTLAVVQTVSGCFYKLAQPYLFRPTSLIVLAEVGKCAWIVCERGSKGVNIFIRVFEVSPQIALQGAALAFLYTLNHHLLFASFGSFGPAVVSLFRSGSIVITGVLRWAAFTQELDRIQWYGFVLTPVGLLIAQAGCVPLSDFVSVRRGPEYAILLGSILVTSVTSVWNSHLVRTNGPEITASLNFLLYVFGSGFAGLLFCLRESPASFFVGHSPITACIVVANIVTGVAVNAVYRSTGVLVKVLSGAAATCALLALEIAFSWNQQSSVALVLGCFVVFLAVLIFMDCPLEEKLHVNLLSRRTFGFFVICAMLFYVTSVYEPQLRH